VKLCEGSQLFPLRNGLLVLSSLKDRLLAHGKSKGKVGRVVESQVFTLIIVILIVANAVFVGILADFEMRLAMEDYRGEVRHEVSFRDRFGYPINTFFTIAFALELVLRVVHLRWFFFFGVDHLWNLLDVVFVAAGFFELAAEDRDIVDVNHVRALRLLRVLRATTTLLRSHSIFGRMRLLLLALGGCLQSLLWVVSLLVFSMFLFAVVFLNSATSYVRSKPEAGLDFDTMTTFFSSMPMTLLTLGMSVLGGLSWWELERTFLNVSPLCSGLLLVYVAIMILALLNVVTGVFVNDSIEFAQNDRDIRTLTEMKNKRAQARVLKLIFEDMDTDRSGTITLGEFKTALESDEVQMLFAALGLDVSDAIGLFQILDADGDDALEIEEFVVGCEGIKGAATALDLMSLTTEVKRLKKNFVNLEKQGKEQLRAIKDRNFF